MKIKNFAVFAVLELAHAQAEAGNKAKIPDSGSGGSLHRVDARRAGFLML